MKRIIKILTLIIACVMISALLSSCNEYKKVAGTYEADTHFSKDYELGSSGKKAKIEKDIFSELVLSEDGVYTYNCFNVEGGEKFESHYQKGKYEIADGNIKLIPSEHWIKGDRGGEWKVAEMTAEEIEKWTVTGEINDEGIKLSLPWFFYYPDMCIEQSFKLKTENA